MWLQAGRKHLCLELSTLLGEVADALLAGCLSCAFTAVAATIFKISSPVIVCASLCHRATSWLVEWAACGVGGIQAIDLSGMFFLSAVMCNGE